jgi:hypothetical protein
MREIRTSGLMSGDGKRGGASASVLAPILDSTNLPPVSQECQEASACVLAQPVDIRCNACHLVTAVTGCGVV